MRISDWSSDVCSSDLARKHHARQLVAVHGALAVLDQVHQALEYPRRQRDRRAVVQQLALGQVQHVAPEAITHVRHGIRVRGRACARMGRTSCSIRASVTALAVRERTARSANVGSGRNRHRAWRSSRAQEGSHSAAVRQDPSLLIPSSLFPLVSPPPAPSARATRSEEHTSELQSLMRSSYAVFCLKNTKHKPQRQSYTSTINTHT